MEEEERSVSDEDDEFGSYENYLDEEEDEGEEDDDDYDGYVDYGSEEDEFDGYWIGSDEEVRISESTSSS